jgi:hypothetical protein
MSEIARPPSRDAAEFDSSFEPFINAKQASGLLHLSAKTLLRFARQGIVPAEVLAPNDSSTSL